MNEKKVITTVLNQDLVIGLGNRFCPKPLMENLIMLYMQSSHLSIIGLGDKLL